MSEIVRALKLTSRPDRIMQDIKKISHACKCKQMHKAKGAYVPALAGHCHTAMSQKISMTPLYLKRHCTRISLPFSTSLMVRQVTLD